MLRKLLLTLAISGACVGLAAAQEQAADPVEAALATRTEEFLRGVRDDEIQAAYERLLNGSLLLRNQGLAELIDKTDDLRADFGECRDIEQFDVRRLGRDIVLLRYLFKCQDFPVVWHVTYYRDQKVPEAVEPTAAWRVVQIRFDTNLEALAAGRGE